MRNTHSSQIRKEIESFKDRMQKVEHLLYQANEENKELRICFNNLVKLMNHELIASLESSTDILKNLSLRK